MAKSNSSTRSGVGGLVADVTGTLGTRVLTMGIGLITGVITARVLGPESRGIFSLVALFPSTLVALSKFGQSQAVISFIRREKEDVAKVGSRWIRPLQRPPSRDE